MWVQVGGLSALRYWSEPMLCRGSSTDSVELPLSYIVRALNDFYSGQSHIQRGLLHIGSEVSTTLSSYPSYFLQSSTWRLFLPSIFPIVAFSLTTLSFNFAFVRPLLLSFDELLGE